MNTTTTARGTSFLLVLLLLAFPSFVQAQIQDNAGTEFIVGFMPNAGGETLEVHLTSSAPTSVTIDYPLNSPTFTTTVPVNPGTITIVGIPIGASQGWTPGNIQNNLIRATAPQEFVLYGINRTPFTSDAYLGLPVDVQNTDYVVMTRGGFVRSFFFGNGQFLIGALFDNTEVTINPVNDLQGGFTAGVPFTINLNRGEGFLGESVEGRILATASLAGTVISSNRPISVINGNRCTEILAAACDHITEQAQPIQSWGNRIFVENLPNRAGGSIYRILAAEDNTTISLDGTPIATIDQDEFHEVGPITGNHIFEGDNAIFVAQFMSGADSPGATSGDPAMGNMSPSEQYLQGYTFSTVGGNQFAQHFLTVIAEDSDVAGGTILLDGSAIPAGDFTPIAGTGFSSAVVPLDDGTHVTSSAGFHGITVEGYNNFDSYIFPGGARFQFINPGMDNTPPVCSGNIDINTFFGTATDLLSDDPENRGIFLVALGAGSTNLSLSVDPFVPGDETVTYQVTRVDPSMDGSGSVVVTDGAGNTCSSDIFLPADGGPPVDMTAPVCGVIVPMFEGPGGAFSGLTTSASDPESGIASVAFTSLVNLNGFVDGNGPFAQGDTYSTPDPNPTSVSIAAERISYASGGRIVVTVTNGAGLTRNCDPVLSQLDAAVPDAFALEAAYPNPFRAGSGAVSVRFRLAEAVPVRLVAYDVLGREVAVLVSDDQAAGTYEVAWPEAATLPAGTYVLRLTAGSFVQTQRITILR